MRNLLHNNHFGQDVKPARKIGKQIQGKYILSVILLLAKTHVYTRVRVLYVLTFFPFTLKSPDKMHSFNPVPQIMTSYFPSARTLYVLPFHSKDVGIVGAPSAPPPSPAPAPTAEVSAIIVE